MAYRARRTSRAAPRRRSTARTGTRRTYATRSRGRVSRGSRSAPQTVRVVIEQAPMTQVARDPLGAARMQVDAGKPQKAKF